MELFVYRAHTPTHSHSWLVCACKPISDTRSAHDATERQQQGRQAERAHQIAHTPLGLPSLTANG